MSADSDIRGQIQAGAFRPAFEALLERYRHKVFRLAYSMLGDAPLAEEASQDVFLQVWRSLPAYRGEASLSSWIFVITRNLCFTRRKQRAAKAAVSLEEPSAARAAAALGGGLSLSPAPPSALDPWALVARLPRPYRDAVTLFYIDEQSYEEVARLMGIPTGTVRTYLFRARKMLAAAANAAQKEVTR